MCTYFKTETDVTQNLIDNFFSNFESEDLSIGRILSEQKLGIQGYFLKRKLCMQNLTKEWKQPPVVILQQAIFYNLFILSL